MVAQAEVPAPVIENITVELSAEECEAILAALPLRTRYGHPVRALFTVMWETSFRIGTLRRLKVPEHYAKGADSLRITQDIDKARYARRMPLTARSRALLDDTCPEKGLLFGPYDYRRTLRTAAKTAGLPADKRKHLSAHDIRHAAATHAQEVSQNIAGAAYMAGHRRTATTAAYMHPNYAAGLAIQHARFGFRHTDSENTNGGETETAPSARNHFVGTGRIELPTPTVSRRRADPPTPHLVIKNGGAEGSQVVKKAANGGFLTHGVSIATLARNVLNDPEATVREAALAGWVLDELKGRGDD